MTSFYPGPSKVYDKIPMYLSDAHASGIMSINHRSPEFMELAKRTEAVLKNKLEIPEGYRVYFVASATECWEILAQSFEEISYHFYNGSFGEKWFNATKKIKAQTIGYKFDLHKELTLGELDLSMEKGIICLTQNETSNGTKVSNKRIAKVRKRYPDHLIAIDATSSMAGDYLKFESADIWYASVQKCFGLPAGLALMICSPEAIAKAKLNTGNQHYNSLTSIIANMEKFQTTHTPNVLNIYLLNRVLKDAQPISKINNKLEARAKDLANLVDSKKAVSLLIKNEKVRSTTVMVIKGQKDEIQRLKEKARDRNMNLGNGYGEWKNDTFRIANFPAITNKEMQKLLQFLDKNLS